MSCQRFLEMAPITSLERLPSIRDSFAVCQVIREWLVSPSVVPSHVRAVAKNDELSLRQFVLEKNASCQRFILSLWVSPGGSLIKISLVSIVDSNTMTQLHRTRHLSFFKSIHVHNLNMAKNSLLKNREIVRGGRKVNSRNKTLRWMSLASSLLLY